MAVLSMENLPSTIQDVFRQKARGDVSCNFHVFAMLILLVQLLCHCFFVPDRVDFTCGFFFSAGYKRGESLAKIGTAVSLSKLGFWTP